MTHMMSGVRAHPGPTDPRESSHRLSTSQRKSLKKGCTNGFIPPIPLPSRRGSFVRHRGWWLGGGGARPGEPSSSSRPASRGSTRRARSSSRRGRSRSSWLAPAGRLRLGSKACDWVDGILFTIFQEGSFLTHLIQSKITRTASPKKCFLKSRRLPF
jgi:hypothetical protein